MKIVFLDIDGVLNSHDFMRRLSDAGEKFDSDGLNGLDPLAVDRLNKLVDVGAQFVISSTWRINAPKAKIANLLEARGFRGFVLGMTPNMPNRVRGNEIRLWIDWWNDNNNDKVDSFVILDDGVTGMESLLPHIVKTEFSDGLQDRHIDAAIKVLDMPAFFGPWEEIRIPIIGMSDDDDPKNFYWKWDDKIGCWKDFSGT